MKKISIIFTAISVVALAGCYKTMDKMSIPGNEIVLSYPSVNQFNLAASGLNFWNKALINPDLGKATDTLKFSLNIPGAFNKDVTVKIGVDKDALKTLEKDTILGASQYQLMPEDYYSIVNPEITIPAGITDTTFKVAIKPSAFDISQTGYVLPVSIISASGVAISPMKTAFIHIDKDPNPPFSRADWKVEDFSSQESEGEGPGNGEVVNLFDNKTNTFWHSQWKGDMPSPPHWFIIDMKSANVLHGIMVLDRQGVGSDGRPKEVKIEVSNDKASWSVAGSFNLADTDKWQKVAFNKPTEAVRYFKMTINSMYGASTVKYTNMAELKLF